MSVIESSNDYLDIQDKIAEKIREINELQSKGKIGVTTDQQIKAVSELNLLQKQAEDLKTTKTIKPISATIKVTDAKDQLKPMKQLTDEQKQQLIASGKQADVDQADLEGDENKLAIVQNILYAAQQITGELTKQGYLSEAEGKMISDTLAAIATGDPIAMAGQAISMIISMFPKTAAAKYAAQIEKINQALRDQQRLIDQAKRTGGEGNRRKEEIELLKAKKSADEAALAAAQKKLDNKIFDVGPVYDERKKKVEELTQRVKDSQLAIEAADQALTDFLAGGVTQNTIADVIAQGFRDGKSSVDDFAQYMDDILLDALMNIFNAQYILPYVNNMIKPVLTQYLADGVIDENEALYLDQLTKRMKEKFQPIWDKATSALGLGSGSKIIDSQLTGAVKGIEQDTANLIAGQLTSIRDYQVRGFEQLESINTQCSHLSAISINTKEANRLLKDEIKTELVTMNAILKERL